MHKLAQEIRQHVAQSRLQSDALQQSPRAEMLRRLDTAQFDEMAKLWRLVDPVGYVRLYQDKPTPRNYFKYQYEHRKVLAEALGRALLRHEIAHHKDGNKVNNIPENLELALNHLEHMRQHPEWRIRKNVTPVTAR